MRWPWRRYLEAVVSPVEVSDRLLVQDGEGKGAQSVALVRLSLSQPLSYQVV